MAVKVVVKGKKEQESQTKQIAIAPPQQQKKRDNIIIRTVRVMLMDIRMRFDPALKKDYGDYSRFCELARGNKK
jgi:hypothetical protein